MKVRIEFTQPVNTGDVFDVSRVPCIGETVAIGFDGRCHDVKSVIHILNADPETQVQAVVRVV